MWSNYEILRRILIVRNVLLWNEIYNVYEMVLDMDNFVDYIIVFLLWMFDWYGFY